MASHGNDHFCVFLVCLRGFIFISLWSLMTRLMCRCGVAGGGGIGRRHSLVLLYLFT